MRFKNFWMCPTTGISIKNASISAHPWKASFLLNVMLSGGSKSDSFLHQHIFFPRAKSWQIAKMPHKSRFLHIDKKPQYGPSCFLGLQKKRVNIVCNFTLRSFSAKNIMFHWSFLLSVTLLHVKCQVYEVSAAKQRANNWNEGHVRVCVVQRPPTTWAFMKAIIRLAQCRIWNAFSF